MAMQITRWFINLFSSQSLIHPDTRSSASCSSLPPSLCWTLRLSPQGLVVKPTSIHEYVHPPVFHPSLLPSLWCLSAAWALFSSGCRRLFKVGRRRLALELCVLLSWKIRAFKCSAIAAGLHPERSPPSALLQSCICVCWSGLQRYAAITPILCMLRTMSCFSSSWSGALLLSSRLFVAVCTLTCSFPMLWSATCCLHDQLLRVNILLARAIESLVALAVVVLILFLFKYFSLRRLRHGELPIERKWKFDSSVSRF